MASESTELAEIPVPPPELVGQVGGGDFHAIGGEFFRYFTELSGLQPHEQVLDVGCGCGRMAVPLTKYLSTEGSYQGFDVQSPAIEWCQKHITPRHPNFAFSRADILNTEYNPGGSCAPRDYRFPYEDGRFDYVFLTSVFTHMLRAEMEHYLDEIVRVMKPKAHCLITFFLLNDEAQEGIDAGRAILTFPHEVGETAVKDKDTPEAAVAFPEAYVRRVFQARGLAIEEPIRFGRWPGRESGLSFQDIVIARR